MKNARLFFMLFSFFYLLCPHLVRAQVGWKWGVASTQGSVESWPVVVDPFGGVIGAGFFGGGSGNDTLISFGGIPIYDTDRSASLFIVKSDSSGHYQWALNTRNSNGIDMTPISLVSDAAGNIYLLGRYPLNYDTATTFSIGSVTLTNTTTSPDPSEPLMCTFIVKLSSTGDVLFAKNIAIVNSIGLGIDDSGQLYVAGMMESDSAIIGSDTLFYTGADGCFVAKYDSSGNFIWAKKPGAMAIGSFAVSGEGNICYVGTYFDSLIIAGDTLRGTGNFIARLNADGLCVWAENIDANAEIIALAWDKFYNIYVCGAFEFPIVFGHDTIMPAFGGSNPFVAKYDPSGGFLWARSAGGQVLTKP